MTPRPLRTPPAFMYLTHPPPTPPLPPLPPPAAEIKAPKRDQNGQKTLKSHCGYEGDPKNISSHKPDFFSCLTSKNVGMGGSIDARFCGVYEQCCSNVLKASYFSLASRASSTPTPRAFFRFYSLWKHSNLWSMNLDELINLLLRFIRGIPQYAVQSFA